MIEQQANAIEFWAFFVASKTGKTGLTVTVDVWGPGHTEIVTGASATELGDGLYYYQLAAGSTAALDSIANALAAQRQAFQR